MKLLWFFSCIAVSSMAAATAFIKLSQTSDTHNPEAFVNVVIFGIAIATLIMVVVKLAKENLKEK